MNNPALFLLSCLLASPAIAQGVYVPQMGSEMVYAGPSLNGTPVANELVKQFTECWKIPADVKNPENYPATLKLNVNKDGTVTKIALGKDMGNRYISDKIFVKMADSAMQAVRVCSPLQNLAPEGYEAWRELEVTFDTRGIRFK